MKKFRTRLFVLDPDLPPELSASGLGWTVRQRHFQIRVPLDHSGGLQPEPERHHHIRAIIGSNFKKDGYLCSRLAPELIIEAKDFDKAQRIMRLIGASYTLTETMLLDEDAVAVPDNPADYPRARAREMELVLRNSSATYGHFRAARIAAAASKKLVYQQALAKYFHGFRLAGRNLIDGDPVQGENISTTADPLIYTNYALAIVAYYSVFEELNVQVNASQDNPSKLKDGSWNPTVLSDLKARMAGLGLDTDSTSVWLLRGTPTRIERKHRPPAGTPTSWAYGMVRDREIPIYDAISYASLLRSRVSAHRTSDRTKSLTMAHVFNVQMLARDILLQVLGDDYTMPPKLHKGSRS